ncbi:uncharacterized protein LOC135473873 [Liolophura sinensis]|uniref:uncharacterized protein LOC135473873 n=1 Tax=Liolophura sinensis TaxID=3198878 RepID=UPI0031584A8A
MGQMRKAKDILCLSKNIASFSDGQASMLDFPDDNMDHLMVRIKPNSGLYLGGTFDFELNLDPYPESSPGVRCVTKIYHPNIDCMEEEDNVCLNILDSGWCQDLHLEDVVHGLLFLLYNPNLGDPLSPLFDSETTYEEYADNVIKSLQGAQIDDFKFDFNFQSESGDGSTTKGDNSDSSPVSEDTACQLVEELKLDEACSSVISPDLGRQISKADHKILVDETNEGLTNICDDNKDVIIYKSQSFKNMIVTPVFTDSLMPEINLMTKVLPTVLNHFLCCLRPNKPECDPPL